MKGIVTREGFAFPPRRAVYNSKRETPRPYVSVRPLTKRQHEWCHIPQRVTYTYHVSEVESHQGRDADFSSWWVVVHPHMVKEPSLVNRTQLFSEWGKTFP